MDFFFPDWNNVPQIPSLLEFLKLLKPKSKGYHRKEEEDYMFSFFFLFLHVGHIS